MPRTYVNLIFLIFCEIMKIADFVGKFLGVPDVRTYLSGIWGLILMLLNILHHLSNGCAPLVDDLGPSAFPRKWAHLRKLAAQN